MGRDTGQDLDHSLAASRTGRGESPTAAMNEERQAATVLAVSHAATPPHATLSRPTPMSIAPNTPPASAGTRPRVPATTTARAGPMNAIHAMGDPVTASSGSNGWR